ncbi:28S ribosomal protein S24, mitochondrial isoform X2 [Lagopus leucura]|nr:28S ribosomal protein S24, mitochondrial isoform X2 [Lagopus leucura]
MVALGGDAMDGAEPGLRAPRGAPCSRRPRDTKGAAGPALPPPQALPGIPALPAARGLHSTPPLLKTRAARVRVGKGDKGVTYERAHPPHYIAHRKGWLSLHTGNLDGEAGAAERAVEDAFVRRFLRGTFPGCLADEVVVKRRANALLLCPLLLRRLPPAKLCFLLGYAEALLAHFYKCPVRIHVQTVSAAPCYKFL